MHRVIGFALIAILTFLTGCVSAPQAPVSLSGERMAPGTRIGIVMAPLPKVDTYQTGADCLLCLATVAVANSTLTAYVTKLPAENIPQLKNDLGQLLEKKGMVVTLIDENVDISKLPKYNGKAVNTAPKSFSALAQKYNVDKLLVIEIDMLGTFRTYSGYVPTSEPKGVFRGKGYIVNVADNTYDWYEPLDILKSSSESWDEPPQFPGLTNAYYQALETGRDSLLKPFMN